MAEYICCAGDVLDAVCKDHYGTEQAIHLVLAANPGLAALGAYLPAGHVIELPEIIVSDAPVIRSTINLWD